jgi:hypothetical protein
MGCASLGKSKGGAHSFAISEAYARSAERKFLRWNCCLMAVHHSANNFGSRKVSFGSKNGLQGISAFGGYPKSA